MEAPRRASYYQISPPVDKRMRRLAKIPLDDEIVFIIHPVLYYNSWIQICNKTGEEVWHARHSRELSDLCNLDLANVKKIIVRILPASHADRHRARIILLWKEVRDLVDLLSNMELPPVFHIELCHEYKGRRCDAIIHGSTIKTTSRSSLTAKILIWRLTGVPSHQTIW